MAENLALWGYSVHRGLGGTGVVGTLKRGTSARAIGIRADMDALPVGSVELACRATAGFLAVKLAGSIVTVENMSGAAGVIAAQRVSQAPADGFTLMVGSSNQFCAIAHVTRCRNMTP